MQIVKSRIIMLTLVLGIRLIFTEGIVFGGEMMSEMKDLSTLNMSYRIEGAYSPYKYIQIDILGKGEGKLSYELYSEYVKEGQRKEDTITFKVEEGLVKELVDLHQAADFFNLEVIDINKDKIRVTDVGTSTLRFSYAGKERSLSYGYVENNPLEDIIRLYWQKIKDILNR